ncbi:MAG: DUF998 domain-containing protein [Jatrophihabitantaceae bacterium]
MALIGGWTWAGAYQADGYHPLQDTLSALAAQQGTAGELMTAALVVLGGCHVVTAAGLPEAGRFARVLLALGGAATIMVAALPQPSAGHLPAAAIAFMALAVWPAASNLPGRRTALLGALTLVALLGWFALELRGGALLGLSERILAGAQALWPLVAALGVQLGRGRARPSVRAAPARRLSS